MSDTVKGALLVALVFALILAAAITLGRHLIRTDQENR